MIQERTFLLFCLLSAGPLPGQSFEVASVKLSPPDSHTETRRWPGGRFTASGVTLRALIQRAYEVQDFQIVGGPKWMDNDRLDIEAIIVHPFGPADNLKVLHFVSPLDECAKSHPRRREAPTRPAARLGVRLRRTEFNRCNLKRLARQWSG